MIITRTPMRLSFTGGGSDLPAYYRQFTGKVVSTSIDKYIYITVNKLTEYFDCKYMLKYSKTEMCDSIKDIQHPIIREVLLYLDIDDRLEITSMADLPAGTGLGSSSSFTVGLINALFAYKNRYESKDTIADTACELEINILNEPIGKQDQYAASFGGLRVISFLPDETVTTDNVICSLSTKNHLSNNLMLFYTGMTRNASGVLLEQKKLTKDDNRVQEAISYMVDQCDSLLSVISNGPTLTEIGYILHRGWMRKKSLVMSISNLEIDDYYQKALSAGAIGGKLCGAGNGGCLLFYVEPQNQDKVRQVLSDLREVKFNFDNEGTKVIYFSE